MLNIAKDNLTTSGIHAELFQMDFLKNEFAKNSFDIIVTHYFFLWIKNLKKSFEELHRILKKKGSLIVFAEPDYGGLIEFPNSSLKDALCTNLRQEGADPEVGRKLNQYFPKKFEVVERFCTSIPWISNINKEDLMKELNFFSQIMKKEDFNPELLKESIELEKYFLFLPVFSYYLKKI